MSNKEYDLNKSKGLMPGKPIASSNQPGGVNDPDTVMEDDREATSLEMLADVASKIHSSQNEVPIELSNKVQLPGSSKRFKPNHYRDSNRATHELDSGLVHLPAKLCDICKKSCHKAPLIQCDFCPLLFHLDCLEPPLTSVPTDSVRWMCPNHAEHHVDRKLLPSVSLSDRVKLHDKFSGQLSQDAVKVRFLNELNDEHPPSSCNITPPPRKFIVVPKPMVQQYKCPPPMLPRFKDSYLNKVNDQNPLNSSSLARKAIPQPPPMLPKSSDVSSNAVNNPTFTAASPKTVPKGDDTKMCSHVSSLLTNVAKRTTMQPKQTDSDHKSPTSLNLSCEPSLLENKLLIGNSTCVHCNKKNASQIGPNIEFVPDGETGSVSSDSKVKSRSSSKVSKKSSTNKLKNASSSPNPAKSSVTNQPLVSHHPSSLNVLQTAQSPIHFSGSGVNPLFLSSPGDILCRMDKNMTLLLASQRLDQLLPKKECEPALETTINVPAELPSHAAVCPVDLRGPIVPMRFRSIYLGLGVDKDVCFSKYGHCNYLSANHATIFYDKITKCYELLNYSSYGTIVDNILYGSDISDKQRCPPHPTSASTAVRKLARSTPRMAELKPPVPTTQKSTNIPSNKQHAYPCKCDENFPSNLVQGSGSEDSAILHHGSCIQCGCLKFVFSISEFGFRIPSNVSER